MKKLLLIPVMLLTLAAGCNDDERLVRFAQEADNRQAQQNNEMARQNQHIAEATKQLVTADAVARKELVELERGLQTEKAEVGHQRDNLEAERRQIAQSRFWDSATAKALDNAAALLGALLPLIICGYLLYHMQRGDTDEAIAEVLVGEIVSEHPALLPRDDEPRSRLAATRAGQLRPDGQKEGTE